jgi:TRAP-type C4-dicarboxylate transport system substrate-binding protein
VDKEKWKEAMSPVYDKFESKIGSELIDKVNRAKQ